MKIKKTPNKWSLKCSKCTRKFRISNIRFLISNIFISNTRLKLAKNQAKVKQHTEAELLLSENYSLCSPTLHSKIKMFKNKCVCFNRIIWLFMMKMRLKIKNRSHKYTKYKMYHNRMMVIYIKQHLSKIWSSSHEKVK